MSKVINVSDRAAPNSGIFGLDDSYQNARLILIPVPWDATTSYGQGAAKGPEIVLKESHQLDLSDAAFGDFYQKGIHMLPIDGEIIARNAIARKAMEHVRKAIDEDGDDSASAKEVDDLSLWLHARIQGRCLEALQSGKQVGLLGGDHASVYGLLGALATREQNFGILHIDAHHDLRSGYESVLHSHAAIMYNVMEDMPQVSKLVSVGIRDYSQEEANYAKQSKGRIQTFYDHDFARRKLAGIPFTTIMSEIIEALPERVYISFDIDGLDPTLCPGTGTPVPGGLQFAEAAFLIESLAKSGRTIVGFDLNEVAPGLNPKWNGNVGARMLFKLCGAILSGSVSLS